MIYNIKTPDGIGTIIEEDDNYYTVSFIYSKNRYKKEECLLLHN